MMTEPNCKYNVDSLIFSLHVVLFILHMEAIIANKREFI